MINNVILLLATYDTKGQEAEYIKQRIVENGIDCITLDVGTGEIPINKAKITLSDLCKGSAFEEHKIRSLKRGEAITIVSELAEKYIKKLVSNNNISTIACIGGAGGTQIASQVLCALDFGLPKIILSTLAAGNTNFYMRDADIIIIPAVADIAGINFVTKIIFDRFAAICTILSQWYVNNHQEYSYSLQNRAIYRIGQTMYGTTTKGITIARKILEQSNLEVIVFHANGYGGKIMERFVKEGLIKGVLDMTLAEIGGHLFNGLHNAGPLRLEMSLEKGIPTVLVPGAVDTIVLPPMSELPEIYKSTRILSFHNKAMTTMRTNNEENIKIGDFIVSKLKKVKNVNIVKVILPLGGLSSIDKPGELFYLPEANEILFHTIRQGLKDTGIEVIDDSRHINDPGFAKDTAEIFLDIMQRHYKI